MANTGLKIVLTLQEINQNTGIPTGMTKPNTVGDPDYIAPYQDLIDCPVNNATNCPVVVATGGVGIIQFEFSLDNQTLLNPIIETVLVKFYQGVSLVGSIPFTLPNPTDNYFSGSGGVPAPNTYTIDIDYLDSGNNPIDTCPNLATVTTT